jgi:hypothetical protein
MSVITQMLQCVVTMAQAAMAVVDNHRGAARTRFFTVADRGFRGGVNLRYQLGRAQVLRCGARTRNQGVQVVGHPQRVDVAGHGSQIIGSHHGGWGIPSVRDLACETDFQSGHVSSGSASAGLFSFESTTTAGQVLI